MENIDTNIAAVPSHTLAAKSSDVTPMLGATPAAVSQPAHKPFTIYEQENHMPYAAEYFGMDRDSFTALAEADISNLLPQLSLIEQYVTDKITNEDYFDSTETFQQIMGNIKDMLGIKDFEPWSQQVGKIARYLNDGKPFAAEFHVQRSSKADELDHARNTKASQFRGQSNFRKMDNLFSKFFNKK